jgi:ABC-2 type transport system permease protein
MTALAPPLPRPTRRTAFGSIVRNEARLAWRQPRGLIAGLGLPILLLFIFDLIPTFRQPAADLGGLTPLSVYVPILIVFGLAMLSFMGLPMPLASYRELGILRRLSTTPVPPSWLLAAQGVVNLFMAVTATLIIVVASIALGAPAPKNPAGFVLSFLLAVAALFAIGLMIAAIARTAGSVSVIGRIAFFPLMFLAGLWWPREEMPGALQVVSEVSPLGATVDAIQASMQGQFPSATPLLVLAGYAIVFGYLARRSFRWE